MTASVQLGRAAFRGAWRFLTWVLLLLLGSASLVWADHKAPLPKVQEIAVSGGGLDAVLVTATDRPSYLVVLLHGIGGDKAYFQTEAFLAEMASYLAKGFSFLIPEGGNSVPLEINAGSKPYRAWNAAAKGKSETSDCCFDLFTRHQNVQRKAHHLSLLASPPAPDHLSQLGGLIKQQAKHLGIPNHKIGVLGISNGAIMAYRLQCSGNPGQFEVMVSLQGTLAGKGGCGPGAAKHVLHIHGDADDVVPFAGGVTKIAPLYPEYRFERTPLASFALIARSAGCAFPPEGDAWQGSMPLSKSRLGAKCPAPRRDFNFLVYHGAGHEFRMTMFTEGMAFLASHLMVARE